MKYHKLTNRYNHTNCVCPKRKSNFQIFELVLASDIFVFIGRYWMIIGGSSALYAFPFETFLGSEVDGPDDL